MIDRDPRGVLWGDQRSDGSGSSAPIRSLHALHRVVSADLGRASSEPFLLMAAPSSPVTTEPIDG
jgi:hypothetical protein